MIIVALNNRFVHHLAHSLALHPYLVSLINAPVHVPIATDMYHRRGLPAPRLSLSRMSQLSQKFINPSPVPIVPNLNVAKGLHAAQQQILCRLFIVGARACPDLPAPWLSHLKNLPLLCPLRYSECKHHLFSGKNHDNNTTQQHPFRPGAA